MIQLQRMSTSAASTEPSVDSNVEENLSAPLWKYVTKDIVVDADGVARAGGGNVSFTCSFCEMSCFEVLISENCYCPKLMDCFFLAFMLLIMNLNHFIYQG